MIRTLRTAALLLACPTALAFAAAAPAAAANVPGGHAAPRACTSVAPIQVNGFAFAPARVAAGASSTADLITTNCAAVSLATDEEWTGQWISAAGTGIPAGCPVIDPLIRYVTYGPDQELAENTTYLVPSGCTAVELAVTVRISSTAGAEITSATAYLQIAQPVSGS
jgi:hypothetical protein